MTVEEKSVLQECRNSALARGVPTGIVSILVLRYLIQNGEQFTLLILSSCPISPTHNICFGMV